MNNTGYSRFLQEQWPQQQPLVARYMLAGEQVWLKRAGPRHGMWRYRLLGAAAGVLRLPVLRPVPNLGGRPAIATELRRLRTLGAPYSDEEIEKAPEEVKGKTELDAIIAYLQVLGIHRK